ncbi:MAG: PilZ domain-containing protein [Armatimonadota bacterium]
MSTQCPVVIRDWLHELCETGAEASLSIAGHELAAFFAGMDDQDVLVMDVLASGEMPSQMDNGEVVVEFHDASGPGRWRLVSDCRQAETIAAGRLLLSLALPREISWADQRSEARVPVSSDMLEATIWLGRERHPARVLDISASGAKLHIAPHRLRIAEARRGTEFTIQFSGPVVAGVSRGHRESRAVVRRVVRDEPPWSLGIELIRPPSVLVAALADYARTAGQ